jgi:hypothetical protein
MQEILINLWSLAQVVLARRAAEAAKAKKERAKELGKVAAASALLHQDQDGDKGSGYQDLEDDQENQPRGNKQKNNIPKRKSKKRKIEGPSLGQGQRSVDSGGGNLAKSLNKIYDQDAAAAAPALASTVLPGRPNELSALGVVHDPESYLDDNSHKRTVAALKGQGVALREVGKSSWRDWQRTC